MSPVLNLLHDDPDSPRHSAVAFGTQHEEVRWATGAHGPPLVPTRKSTHEAQHPRGAAPTRSSTHEEQHAGLNEGRTAPGSVEHTVPGCVWRGAPGGAARLPLPTGQWVPDQHGPWLPILPTCDVVKTLAHAETGGPHPENRIPQMPLGVYVKVT